MTRPECTRTKSNNADRCDLYDTEGWCRYYGDTWLCERDNKYHGGQDVETITYCTHRTINKKRINNAMNPLHMDRIPRWNEVIFNGKIRFRHNDVYCPDGIIVWGDDGRMEDPITGMVQLKDGTMLTSQEYFETTPIGKNLLEFVNKVREKK
jgi:hypothetical protein